MQAPSITRIIFDTRDLISFPFIGNPQIDFVIRSSPQAATLVYTTNPWVVLLILNIIFLIIGCFMDANAAILILTPAIWPLITAVGIDPTHLGLVMVLNLMIGLLTPPVGMCLFTVSRVVNLPLDRMIKAVIPFYIPLLACLLIVTFCPSIVLFLPNALAG